MENFKVGDEVLIPLKLRDYNFCQPYDKGGRFITAIPADTEARITLIEDGLIYINYFGLSIMINERYLVNLKDREVFEKRREFYKKLKRHLESLEHKDYSTFMSYNFSKMECCIYCDEIDIKVLMDELVEIKEIIYSFSPELQPYQIKVKEQVEEDKERLYINFTIIYNPDNANI